MCVRVRVCVVNFIRSFSSRFHAKINIQRINPTNFHADFYASRLVTFLFVDISEFFSAVCRSFHRFFTLLTLSLSRVLLWTVGCYRFRRALDISNQSIHLFKLPLVLSDESLFICPSIFRSSTYDQSIFRTTSLLRV